MNYRFIFRSRFGEELAQIAVLVTKAESTSDPNTTCCISNNKNFGVVTGTEPGTNPRLIQFGLKFSF